MIVSGQMGLWDNWVLRSQSVLQLYRLLKPLRNGNYWIHNDAMWHEWPENIKICTFACILIGDRVNCWSREEFGQSMHLVRRMHFTLPSSDCWFGNPSTLWNPDFNPDRQAKSNFSDLDNLDWLPSWLQYFGTREFGPLLYCNCGNAARPSQKMLACAWNNYSVCLPIMARHNWWKWLSKPLTCSAFAPIPISALKTAFKPSLTM